ncbi:Cupredoxin [Mycena filopes]|nr:Cupredoxin [Mycena filopes]
MITTTSTLAALALALLPAALAQQMHEVSVGAGGNLVYDPPSISAAKGDTVRFTFNPKNHTVTQSSFAAPCVPLTGGATSGFQPVTNVSALLPTWEFTVADDTTPAWFHCEQTVPASHCGAGMVFAINAPADPDPHSFSNFQKLAEQLNGTATASMPASSSDAYTTPPAQSWATATATVTDGASTWTTVYTSYAGTPAPTYAPTPMEHKILVGANGLTFTPSNISAAIGDTVLFEFHPKNHTVTQSSFLSPCKALAETSTTGQVGFKSGFQFVDPSATTFPTFTITINDVRMVFSINAVESGPNNFNAFQTLANRSGSDSAAAAASGGSGTGTGTGTAGAPGASQNTDGAVGGASVSGAAALLLLGALALL